MSRNAKHIDRRVLRSRKAIIEAFDRLLEEKELDQITVSAIAREANIDRKTFYVHFGTIDGLLDALAEERVDEILDVMEDALSAASPDMELEVAVAKFFDIANQVVCTKLVDSVCRRKSFPADELLTRVLKSFKVKLVERDMLFAQIPDDLLEFHLSYIMGGIISIYKIETITWCSMHKMDKWVRWYLCNLYNFNNILYNALRFHGCNKQYK